MALSIVDIQKLKEERLSRESSDTARVYTLPDEPTKLQEITYNLCDELLDILSCSRLDANTFMAEHDLNVQDLNDIFGHNYNVLSVEKLCSIIDGLKLYLKNNPSITTKSLQDK